MTLPRSVGARSLSLDAAVACPFVMASRHEVLVAGGVARLLPDGPAQDLAPRAAGFFSNPEVGREALLVGALPFDHGRHALLYQPASVTRVIAPADRAVLRDLLPERQTVEPRHWCVSAEPTAAQYRAGVERALGLLHSSGDWPAELRKVVLARSLALTADAPIDPVAVLERLQADWRVTTFAVPLPAGPGRGRTLVGATPERLIAKRGRQVSSLPLAGSARRQSDPAADTAAAEALLRSEKDRREHAAVVEWIADQLTPYCRTLQVPAEPGLVSTETMWHLGTQIEGELADASVSSLELALALHPTPAVCGLPQAAAAAAIDEVEGFDRGFFTGAIGWCNAQGDGEWLVTIRCAEIEDRAARLYAGAGLVAGSDPQAEVAETSAKFVALLNALGIDESGRPLDEHPR